MQVIHTIADFRQWHAAVPADGLLPFVPTMGALHDGHASLLRKARILADASPHPGKVVASIFVNPTQFGQAEDFAKYPRTLDADIRILQDARCDAVFVPAADEMYPALKNKAAHLNAATQEQSATIDPGPIANILEGAIRPGHFRGVCSVVAKLLNIVQPTHLLLGQKDFQQQAVLRQMCCDLNFPTAVVTCPTLRESDGLAMSSRNRYLSPEERPRAVALHQALQAAKCALDAGDLSPASLQQKMHAVLQSKSLAIQYATVRHPQTLAEYAGNIALPCVLLIAAKLGSTRLIDNLLVPPN